MVQLVDDDIPEAGFDLKASDPDILILGTHAHSILRSNDDFIQGQQSTEFANLRPNAFASYHLSPMLKQDLKLTQEDKPSADESLKKKSHEIPLEAQNNFNLNIRSHLLLELHEREADDGQV